MTLTYYGWFRWARQIGFCCSTSQKKLDAFKERLSQDLNMDTVKDAAKSETMPTSVKMLALLLPRLVPSLFMEALWSNSVPSLGHTMDITGEDMNWVRHMPLMAAVSRNSTTTNWWCQACPICCGHDYIPWDIMVMRMKNTLRKDCNDNLQSVTLWDELEGGFAGSMLGTAAAATVRVEQGKLPIAFKIDLEIFQRTANGEESS